MADAAGAGLLAAITALAEVHPGGRMVRGRNGTLLLTSGVRLASLNGVFSGGRETDSQEIDRLAGILAGEGLPWSIAVRGEPTNEVLDVAERYGRQERVVQPLMGCRRAEARFRGAADGGARGSDTLAVRVVRSDQQKAYAELLGAAFEAPADIFRDLMAGPLLDASWGTAYVGDVDGVPVGAGYGIRIGDQIGVFNIAVVPEFRGRGYGRLITERVLADGFAAGARSAYLQATEAGLPLYESMGFRALENWTYLA